jgi:hypothetical protein
LARTYGQLPEVFLAMPLDEVHQHKAWTEAMLAAGEQAQAVLRRRNDG